MEDHLTFSEDVIDDYLPPILEHMYTNDANLLVSSNQRASPHTTDYIEPVFFYGIWGFIVCMLMWLSFCVKGRYGHRTDEDDKREDSTMVDTSLIAQAVLSDIPEVDDEMVDASSDSQDEADHDVEKQVLEASDMIESPKTDKTDTHVAPRRSKRLAQHRRQQQSTVLDAVNAFIDNAVKHNKLE